MDSGKEETKLFFKIKNLPCCKSYARYVKKTNGMRETQTLAMYEDFLAFFCLLALFVKKRTCHLSLMPTTTATNPPLLTSPLCTVKWFAKTKNQINFLIHWTSKQRRKKKKKNVWRHANISDRHSDTYAKDRYCTLQSDSA